MRDGSRARELLPTIVLTLLSVVQALALEALWSAVHENPLFFAGGADAWVVWLQALAIFQGIIVVWLFYIAIVMRFSWIPATRDSIAPFVLGAGELSMIQTMDPDLLAWWFWILAAIFAFSTRISNSMFAAGLQDPSNTGVWMPQPGGALERSASYLAAGGIALLGGLVWWQGGNGAVALVSVVFANLALFGQAMLIQHYWRLWVGAVDDGAS